MSKPELLEPDKVYEYQLDLWQTGLTVKPGSRLRVEVASAAFPLFSRNLNTGGHNEKETTFVPAKQTILHSQGAPVPRPAPGPAGVRGEEAVSARPGEPDDSDFVH